MSLTATEKKVRSRCDSPAARVATATVTHSHDPVRKEISHEQKPTPPLSVVAFLAAVLLLGRAAFLTDSQEPLGDRTTWAMLITFFAMGALAMRSDVLDMVQDEAEKEGHPPPASSSAGLPWLVISAFLMVLLAMTLASSPEALQSSKIQDITPRIKSVSITEAQAVHMYEELSSRSAKLKGIAHDIENVHGRNLDASLVRGVDYQARLTSAARRCASDEVAAILAAVPKKCFEPATPRSWNTSIDWSNEAAIFFLSALLALGLAASRSDVLDISEAEANGAAVEFPSADKPLKPSRGHGQWRLFACGALLLAVAASMVASIMEDM